MRISLWLVIGLILFGGVSNMLLATGVYDVSYADQISTPFDEEDIKQLTEGAASSEDNPIGGYNWLYIAGTTILGAVVSALTIIPLGLALNIPLPIILIFQSPIWVIYGMELYALHKQVVIA